MDADAEAPLPAVIRQGWQLSAALLGSASLVVGSRGRTLAALLLLQHTLGLSLAATTVGMSSLGAAVVAPLRGRLVDRQGPIRVALPMLLVHTSAWTLLVVLVDHSPSWVVIALALLGGAAFPPGFAIARTAVSSSAGDGSNRSRAFSYLAAIQEAGEVAAPAIAGVIVAASDPSTGLLTMIAFTFIGLALALGAYPRDQDHGASKRGRSVLGPIRHKQQQRLMLAGFIAVAVSAAATVLTVSHYGGSSAAMTGVAVAALAIGGVIGSLTFGRTNPARRARTMVGATAVGAGSLVGLGFNPPSSPVWVTLMLVLGLALAPITVMVLEGLDTAVQPHERTEAFAWIGSSQLLGAACGSNLAGLILPSSMILGTSAAILLAIPLIALARLPDRIITRRR